MANTPSGTYAAFLGHRLIHRGPLPALLAAIKRGGYDRRHGELLIFDNGTGREVDFDLRGSLPEVLERIVEADPPKRRGRPPLGVESREVTLLPRHWAWLGQQSGGASAAIRRLVEGASRRGDPAGEHRTRRDAVYRVMSALAGNLPGFEEASRALFADNVERFKGEIAAWPVDFRHHLLWLLGESAGTHLEA